MNDAEVINEAYTETLKGLFSVLFDSLAAAIKDKTTDSRADEAFRQGLAMARKARDRALELVK